MRFLDFRIDFGGPGRVVNIFDAAAVSDEMIYIFSREEKYCTDRVFPHRIKSTDSDE